MFTGFIGLSLIILYGELVNLNREDINFNERECVVFGKGNSERIVYFDARTKIHLRNYLDSRTDENPAMFVSLTMPRERLMTGGVETRLRELGNRAELQKVHPHKFRRTLATRAIDKGMPIEQVQKLLGHVKIDTTMGYAQVHEDVADYFDWIENEQPKSESIDRYKSRAEKGHGRIETREILKASADWLEGKENWADIQTIIRYRCTREIDGVKTVSIRHYISSFDTNAEGFLELIRGHWSIENQLHWMLDVVFREDDARARKDNSPLNLNVLRKIALAVLKKIAIKGSSVRRKMMKAARDPNFLAKLLFQM